MTYSAEVLADSPLVYWRLGESSGTVAADASGNGHTGTYTNGVALGAPGYTGDGNTAATFDGTAIQVVVGASTVVGPTTLGSFTLEAIVNIDTSLAYPFNVGEIVVLGDPLLFSQDIIALEYVDGVFQASFQGTGVFSPTAAAAGSGVHHLAVTYNGTNLILYLDGVAADTQAFSNAGALLTTADSLSVGNYPPIGTTPAAVGVIDEAAFYTTALSAARVLAHANAVVMPTSYAATFTPPTENTVSNVAYEVPPIWNRLMRFYPTRKRGRAVWRLPSSTSGGGSHDGTYVNSPTLGAPGLVVGDSDTAVSLTAASNQYVVQSDTIAAQTFTAFTMGALINMPEYPPGGIGYFGSVFDGVSGIIQLTVNGDGSYGATVISNDTIVDGGPVGDTNLALNTTYRVILTWDGATTTLYLDGVSDGAVAFSDAMSLANATKFIVGSDDVSGNSNNFSGVVDEWFFVANHAATTGEVATIDAAWTGTGSASDAVLALTPYLFWRFGEASGTTAEDSAGGVVVDNPFTFDQPYPSTEDTLVNRESLFPASPTPPSGLGTSTSNLTEVTYEYVYLGGHVYQVTAAEEALLAAFLVSEGYTPSDWLVPI